MRIFISNDDGHFSPGIAALEAAARRLSDDVWVLAPDRKRSSMGHSLSLHDDFQVRRLGDERHYSCSGTPADCMAAAMTWLFADQAPPDLVLSGINEGRNMGEDVAYSGTLAIAREASFWGLPALAFSAPNGAQFDAPAIDWLAQLISTLWQARAEWHAEGHWLALNLPPRIPAPLRPAIVGRAKIAAATEVVAEADDGVTLRYRSGRRSTPREHDEWSFVERGEACIYRLNWHDSTPLDAALLARLNPETR